ncbi:hypothetical protein SLEP1_g9424 [Rubroshorea leprosula]|uniref:Reverse transcriptase/retrotransposon-derived protein RNase H-like domain-containing protein n=1 Tax=Rubroshorea leprosula TaxID=152421 RepID=A0AAV5ICU2_9ROSI|nr:hypothetical protein SLEP1_g9424 [Rubroshorea leprosula]
MPVTRATSSHIVDGNHEPSQDDGWEVQQPRPSTDVFHDILQGIIDPNLASLVQVIQYDGRKGSAMEHVSKFLDAIRAHASDRDLCLREFSKSLSDKAYTCEKHITILDLHNTRQYTWEDLMAYVKRFRDLALDCYGGHDESFLVEICINNMFPIFRAILKNIGINQFGRLLDAVKRTAISVKVISIGKSATKLIEKKTAVHTLAVFARGQGQGGLLTVPSHYLRRIANPTMMTSATPSLRRVVRSTEGRQRVDEDLLPCHNQGAVNVLTYVESIGVNEPIVEFPDNMPSFFVQAILFIANEAEKECLNIEAHASYVYLESSNVVTFIDEDMKVPYPDHRKPLYLFALINSIGVKRALVNTRSSLNLVLLSTIIAVGIPQRRIVKSPLSIVGFSSSTMHEMVPIASSVAMSLDHLFFTLERDTLIGEQGLSNKAECLALEAGNEILDEHLDFSSETNHLILPDKLPTLHEAQPALTSLEPLEAVDLEDDPANPRHVHISTTLSTRLDPTLVAHSLNVNPNMKPIMQPNRAFHPEVTLQIKEEVEKFLAARFIKPTKKSTWLANIVPVRKKNGHIRCCVDFHDLNKACSKDEFFVPNMDVLIDNIIGCEMYSFMDGNRFLVSKHNISVDLAKSEAIRAMQPPKNLKQLRSFIGKVLYLCRFIPSLAEILSAFSPLLKKGAAFVWTTKQQNAFLHLQDLMLILLVISIPIQGRPFKVYLSTSNKAMSALVAQDDQGGKEQLVYYVNRNLKGTESRYPFIEKICLALIYGQAVVDLLSEFFGEVQYPISNEVPGGEVATAHEIDEEWTLYFNGSSMAEEAGARAEYKAYLIRLAMAKEASVQHLAQSFANIRYEQIPWMENQLADALATIASRVPMAERPFSIQIVRRVRPIHHNCESVLLDLMVLWIHHKG